MLFSILLLLAPAYAADNVTERHEMIPMRDGARLSTYLYIPQGNGPWPVHYEQSYANLRGDAQRKRYSSLAAHG